jgi:dephospho-CoA kinase
MTNASVVVISGQVAAGKTTAARMLEKRGFQYARIAKAIKKLRWPSDRPDTPPRSWYQQMGQELHETIGQKALCDETMTFVSRPDAPFVIDGARWKEDVAYFRDRFGDRVIHLHLSAPTDVRKRRFEAREKDVSFEEADGGEVESEVPLLAPTADNAFQNDSDDPERLSRFLDLALRGAGSAG